MQTHEHQYLFTRAAEGDIAAALTLTAALPLSLSSAPNYGWGEHVGNATWRAEIPYKPDSFVAYDDMAGIAVYKVYVMFCTATQEPLTQERHP